LVVTVCLQETPILEELVKTRQVATFMKTRFVLQILLQTAQLYLRYLRNIDRMSSRIEAEVHGAMRNEQVIKLFNLEKSLVYFTTSLRSNGIVFDKLFRSKLAKGDPELETTSRLLRMYPDDEDLLEDVITENRQALEMGETHSVILSGMLDAFASLVSNNLNVVMKFLTSVTIVMALPTMVASFFGMNVALPFARHPQAFGIVLGISVALAGVVALLMARRRMF
jgi:magnesium transporter